MTPRKSASDHMMRVDLRVLTIILALMSAWFAFKPSITAPARDAAETTVAIQNLTTTVTELKGAVATLSDKIANDRAANAADLANLKTWAEASVKDRQAIHEELQRLTDRVNANTAAINHK